MGGNASLILIGPHSSDDSILTQLQLLLSHCPNPKKKHSVDS
jgi:hypothetical protein